MPDFSLIDWPLKSAEKPSIEEIDKLGDALNDVSRRAAAQWLLLLSLWAYLFFTAVAVTDYELLVLPTVKLPFVNVELGLFSFFLWGPLLFFIVQLHFARKTALLAATAGRYMALTKAGETSPRRLENRRHRLDAFAAVGLLCRFDRLGAEKPDWFLRLLTALTVWTTFFLLPAVLYGAFFVRFLAYQHETMTWLHRGLLSAGTAAAWFSVWRVGGFGGAPGRLAGGVSALLAVVAVGLSVAVFTFPGEEHRQPAWDDLRAGLPYEWARLLPKEKSAWVPNILKPVQPDAQFVKLTEAGKGAEARRLNLAHRDFSRRKLRGAQLAGANLQGVDLREAQLQGVDLGSAQLQGADLGSAQLQGAVMWDVQLQDANLTDTVLYGADMENAHLQGAIISNARLQGSNLRFAQLQGATLWSSQLQGVDLASAQLQGADLSYARLQAAELWNAQLQGANLTGANLWRTNFLLLAVEGVFFDRREYDIFSLIEEETSKSPGSYLSQVDAWQIFLPKDKFRRKKMEEMLRRLIVPGDLQREQKELDAVKHRLEAASDAVTPGDRAKLIVDHVCRHEHGADILRGVVRQGREDVSLAELSASLSRPDCAILAAALTKEDRRRLDQLIEWEKWRFTPSR